MAREQGNDRRDRIRAGAVAFGIYLAVSFLFFGVRVIADFDSHTIGIGEDPPFLAWALKWWPQAIANGWNPLHTEIAYPPQGLDLAWLTGIPGPSAFLAPVTQTAGPIAAYNLLSILAPALNAWAAYLLCRSLGARLWPSVAGGYLFGFSSYVIAETLGHPNLTLSFCIPLAGYLLVRRFGASLSPRAFVVAMTAVLGFQFLTSTEIFLTLGMFGALLLVLGVLLYPQDRDHIWSIAKLVLLAYVLVAVLVSPYLISVLKNPGTLDLYSYSTDPVNLVIPTEMTLLGGDALDSVSSRFDGGLLEQGGYLGLPLLLIAVLFWRERRDRFAKLILIAALVALVATLGPQLTVLGSDTVLRLPWIVAAHLPVFKYIIPIRLMLYVWLLLSVVVALWLSRGGNSRWALGALVLVSLLPNFFVTLHGTQQQALAGEAQSPWDWPRSVPEFFHSPQQRAILDGRGPAVILPYHFRGDSILWQAEANMSFSMAGGYVSATIPDEYDCWPIFHSLTAERFRPAERGDLIAFLRAKGVGTVLVEKSYVPTAAPLLRGLPGTQRDLGGMRLYLLPKEFSAGGATSRCPQTS